MTIENNVLKVDYTLKTPEERTALVNKIVENTPSSQLTPKYLEYLADYILDALSKEEKKEKEILTDNRLVTVNKRETSYEGLVGKFENGEDGLYNLITDDKNVILTPKVSITQEDIDTIPGLKELRENIEKLEIQAKKATGKRKYLLKKQIIEMRQDQYVLKNIFNPPMYSTCYTRSPSKIELNGDTWFDENDEPISNDLVSLFNYKHISAILCNYEMLSNSLKYKFSSDFHYLMEDFDKVMEEALKDYPLYADLVRYKTEGKQNIEIQELLNNTYNIKHSVEYISSLWRNKIPKLIADKAKENYIIWYYTHIEQGKFKKCSRCGCVKLAHNRFFSKNSSSKDGYYSICKVCRNAKNKN